MMLQTENKYFSILPFIFGVLVVLLPFLVFVVFRTGDVEIKLEILNTISQILVAASVILAFTKYYETKEKERISKSIELVSFFRKEVISLHANIVNLAKAEKGESYKIHRSILPDNPRLEDYVAISKTEYDQQYEITAIKGVSDIVTQLLNSLEELSSNIIYYRLVSHPALSPIINPFVTCVEQFGYQLLISREIAVGIPTYSSVLTVYQEWKNLVNRLDSEIEIKQVIEKIKRKRLHNSD